MNLPSREESFKILEDLRTPKHVISHSLMVNKVAVFLAKRLRQKGEKINLKLVDRASLLHDCLRVCDFNNFNQEYFEEEITEEDKVLWNKIKKKYSEKNHGQAACEFFKEKYPEMAEVIRKHEYSIILTEGFNNWEEKLVNFADKRVKHDKIVSLKTRFEDGHKRYSDDNFMMKEKRKQGVDIEKVDALNFELEKEIFSKLDIEPDYLKQLQPLPTKLIIFDFDGVIEDSFNVTCEVYKKYHEIFNIKLKKDDPDYFREIFESDWKITLRRVGIKEEDIPKCVDIYMDHVTKNNDRIVMYPKIKEVIKELSKKYKLAIATNNHNEIVLPKLKKYGLERYFDLVLDTKDGYKPEITQIKKCFKHFNVKPGETIIIGDMDGDIVVGKRAGLKQSIAVTYGYHSKHKLELADVIVNKPEHLLDVID